MEAATKNDNGKSGITGAVIVAAGKGTRMGTDVAKQFLHLAGEPLIIHTLRTFCQSPVIDRIVVVTSVGDLAYMKQLLQQYAELDRIHQVVVGGAERQDSVRAGIQSLGADCEWVLVHDGARPLVNIEYIASCLEQAQQSGAAVMAVPVKDTIKVVDGSGVIVSTPDRKSLWAVQTPQAFRVSELLDAHEWALKQGIVATDDAMLLEEQGFPPTIVEGDYTNLKVTTPEDLPLAEYMMETFRRKRSANEGEAMLRIGQGFDVHQLVEGRPCIIGGVQIPYEKGLDGHSDADVLLHAITDAILGALGKGDIGRHFPDTDPLYKDADSAALLQQVWSNAQHMGYTLGNLDATVIAQQPKLSPHISQIVQRISEILATDIERLNVKATTSERLGFTGRGEGIAAMAVVCLTKTVL